MKTTPFWLFVWRSFVLRWTGMKVICQFALKRWYVFRNTPDWLVQVFANEGDEVGGDDKKWREFIHQAKDEWALRKRQRNRRREINQRCECGAKTCICDINKAFEALKGGR